jgi:hypothetical protein
VLDGVGTAACDPNEGVLASGALKGVTGLGDSTGIRVFVPAAASRTASRARGKHTATRRSWTADVWKVVAVMANLKDSVASSSLQNPIECSHDLCSSTTSPTLFLMDCSGGLLA